MAKSINKVELLGRVGADPEMRYTASGTAVTQLRLATDRVRKGGESETDWHSIVVWDKLAEACANYVEKGAKALRLGPPGAELLDRRRRAAALPHRDSRPGGGVPGLRPQRRRRQPHRQRLRQRGQRRRQPPGQRQRPGLPGRPSLLAVQSSIDAFPKAQHGAAP